MKTLLDDGLAALSDLLQSGTASCHPETETRLARLAKDWEATGLHTGAKLLEELAQALAQRRHGGNVTAWNLMDLAGKAARYTRFCIQKYGLDSAKEQLNQIYESEEEEEPENHETDS